MLKPLTPQSPARIEWETAVAHAVCLLAECSNGDAQGIMEANPDVVDNCHASGDSPQECAMHLPPGADASKVFTPSESEVDAAEAALLKAHAKITSGKRLCASNWHSNTVQTSDGAVYAYAAGPTECDRIVACVNACDGIADPEATIKAMRDTIAQLNAAIGAKNQELIESTKRNIAYRVALGGVLPYARTRAEDIHTLACKTDGQAGRDLSGAWRGAFDAVALGDKLMREGF